MLLFHFLCRGCCQRRRCGAIFVSELLLNNSMSTMLLFDVILPIVLLDVEHVVVVEFCKIHSLDVRSCCARCCCGSCFPYLVVELFVEIVVADDVDFAYVLLDVEDILGVERLVGHSLIVKSGPPGCSQRCLPYLCCELAVEQLCPDDADFPMLEWMLRALSTLSFSTSILLLSGLVIQVVVVHIIVANFVDKTSSSHRCCRSCW